MGSSLCLPAVTLRRRRHWIALGGGLWFALPFYSALAIPNLACWAASLIFAALALAGHAWLSRRWPLARRGRLDVDASGLRFRGVQERSASSFWTGVLNGDGSLHLRSYYGALGDLEIVAPDDAAAQAILLTLNLTPQGRSPRRDEHLSMAFTKFRLAAEDIRPPERERAAEREPAGSSRARVFAASCGPTPTRSLRGARASPHPATSSERHRLRRRPRGPTRERKALREPATEPRPEAAEAFCPSFHAPPSEAATSTRSASATSRRDAERSPPRRRPSRAPRSASPTNRPDVFPSAHCNIPRRFAHGVHARTVTQTRASGCVFRGPPYLASRLSRRRRSNFRASVPAPRDDEGLHGRAETL